MNSDFPENKYFRICPYPGFYKAAAAISFDHETSAQSRKPSLKSDLKTGYLKLRNKLLPNKRDLSGRYGRGYASRLSVEKILRVFQELNIHGTWFSTGHVLLKENKNKKAFRINQNLPYATNAAGFTDATTWRQYHNSFYHEPFSDYSSYPWYYLGDQTEQLKEMGEDIQCHSFSHPYVALEPVENFRIDLEDWQNAAVKNGFSPAIAFAFPFLGDYYLHYPGFDLNTIPVVRLKDERYEEIGLKPEHFQILRENGFELLTRCGSKQSHPPISGFAKYDDKGIFFMKDKGLLSFNTNSEFAIYLDLIVEGCYTVDFWLHPNDVYFEAEFLRFKNMLEVMVSKQKQNQIWIATIKEQWLRYKAIKKCQLETLKNKKILTVYILNEGNEIINDLAFDFPENFVPFDLVSLFIYQNNRVVAKKIYPKEKHEFKLRIDS